MGEKGLKGAPCWASYLPTLNTILYVETHPGMSTIWNKSQLVTTMGLQQCLLCQQMGCYFVNKDRGINL